jgi:MerR family transcriptional regulator, light-induced transcriptional regulator
MIDHKESGIAILNSKDQLARRIIDRQYDENPALWAKWGKNGWDRCLEDTEYHIGYLAESINSNSPEVFTNYIKWTRSLFESLGLDMKSFIRNLELIAELIIEEIPETESVVNSRVELSKEILQQEFIPEDSYIDTSDQLGNSAKEYLNRLLHGKRSLAVQYILNLVEAGISIKDVYSRIFQPVQYEIGRLWQTGKISVAQEHYATAVTQLAMAQLYPKIFETPKNGRTMIATCPTGELHEIGVRMLADIFELSGWDTYFLGANTPDSSILNTIESQEPDIVAISATMTFHLSKVEKLIDYIRRSNFEKTKIIVGGYVFKSVPNLWKEVGANGFAPDAEQALVLVDNLN